MALETSILNTIKKSLGFAADYTAFDDDIVMAINSAINALTQMGVGPAAGFRITGSTETWSSFIGTTLLSLELVKQYIYLKVRKIFDPPTSSSVAQAIDNEIKELEWRIYVTVDPDPEEDEDE